MGTADRSETLRLLQNRRSAIADSWYRAIASTGFTRLTAAEVRRRLEELSEQAVGLLLSEPFERRQARELGSALVSMHYLSSEALSGTQEVLARQLLEGLEDEQIVALQPRLAAILSQLAAGFTEKARDQVLKEQDEIRAALLRERARVEHALRRSEASLAEAQRIARVGHWEYNFEEEKVRWSDEIYRIFGVAGKDFGETYDAYLRFVHPDDLPIIARAGQEALQVGGIVTYEYRVIRPNGELRNVQQSMEYTLDYDRMPPEEYGGVLAQFLSQGAEPEDYFNLISAALKEVGRLAGRPVRLVGAVQDITERKRAEEVLRRAHDELELRVRERTAELAQANEELRAEIARRERSEVALREGEAKYRTLVEQIPAVTYIEERDEGEPEWDLVYVSPQVEALLGYTPEEYLSEPKIWERLLYPDDRERVLAEEARTKETGEPFGVQYRIFTRTGDVAWIRDETILVRDEEGRSLFRQGVMYDITDQKRAEEEVRRLNEELERRVAERTAQLEAYAEKLQRSNRELQDFAYIASHDLQEPLRKVLTFGDRLKAKYGEALGEQGRDYVERMEGAAARMRDLVDDLLTLSRVTTEARPFAPVDLTEVAREVISDLEARIEEVGGHVEVHELPTIEADRLQMRQLLQNLIGNALKFHKRSGEAPVVKVRPEISEERRGARDAGSARNELCRITVEDNGIGFDEEHLERIFMPFQRLHGRDVYEGTGMGLAICRKVVERHGGKITAEGAPGRGATFTVTLPMVQLGRESWAGRDELGHHATPGR